MDCALFLRGVNVGGIKVPMAELRACNARLEADTAACPRVADEVAAQLDASLAP